MSKVAKRIADNLAKVRERIDSAAVSVGRDPSEVKLVAVSKYVGVVETAALLDAGCHCLGESRPQQIWDKAVAPELANAEWHLIGHLQRNKVRRTLPLVNLIHSIDSLRLLETIDSIASEVNLTSQVLLEVNCSGDESKDGMSTNELQSVLAKASDLSNVKICGLMTMATLNGGEKIAERNFSTLREIRDDVQRECPSEAVLAELSMGMSQDFEAAIRQGATVVRVGSLLFEGLKE
jgi:pyridoxal phosphate enzyme (YggS family)